MKYLYLLLLVVILQPSYAQIQRAFITKEGKITNFAQIATSYILISKIADSVYVLRQFNMRDTIMMQGFYKDELLKVPNGKFVYYQKNTILPDTGKIPHHYDYKNLDTNNYVRAVKYYINGQRAGIWIDFESRGKRLSEATYENDKLNGPFKEYDIYSGNWTSGNMVNDTISGTTYMYNEDSLLIAETSFKNGVMKDHILHLQDAKPKYDFDSYMERSLKPYKSQLITSSPIIKFTVNSLGKITETKIITGVNPEVDTAIKAAIANAPPFVPAKYNNVAVTDKFTQQLLLYRPRNYSMRGSYSSMKFIPATRLQNEFYSTGNGSGYVILQSKDPFH